jgi:hypothetical protein
MGFLIACNDRPGAGIDAGCKYIGVNAWPERMMVRGTPEDAETNSARHFIILTFKRYLFSFPKAPTICVTAKPSCPGDFFEEHL